MRDGNQHRHALCHIDALVPSLPMRDGNRYFFADFALPEHSSEPTYEGWKLLEACKEDEGTIEFRAYL